MRALLHSILCLSLALSGLGAAAESGRDPLCDHFLLQLSRPLVDFAADYDFPTVAVRAKFGPLAIVEGTDLYRFEEEIYDLYLNTPPSARPWNSFTERWELSDDELKVVQAYYGLLFFDGDEKVVGSLEPLFAHVQKIARIELLKTSKDQAVPRHGFYVQNASRGVPAMAADLGITPAQVYRDLNFLGISLLQSGRQARTSSRLRLSWNRILPDPSSNNPRLEDELLVMLKNKGLSHQEIVQTLNSAAGVSEASDPLYRSESEVKARLKYLGWEAGPESDDVFKEGYGDLKINGRLTPVLVIKFILHHRSEHDLEWMAQQLQVTPQYLRDFLKRQRLQGLLEKKLGQEGDLAHLRTGSLIGDAQGLRSIVQTYELHDVGILGVHEFILRGHHVPSQAQLQDILGVKPSEFWGEEGHLSRSRAWEKVLARLDSNESLSAEQRAEIQQVLQWEIRHLRALELPPNEQWRLCVSNLAQHLIDSSSEFEHLPATTLNPHGRPSNMDLALGSPYNGLLLRTGLERIHLVQALKDSIEGNAQLGQTQRASLLALIHRELDRLQFLNLDVPQQIKEAKERLILYLAENQQPIQTSQYSNILRVDYRGFLKRANMSARQFVEESLDELEQSDILDNEEYSQDIKLVVKGLLMQARNLTQRPRN